MEKMKKAIIAILTAVLLLCSVGVAGCKSSGKDDKENSGKNNGTIKFICSLPASEGLEYALTEEGDGYAVVGMGTCTDADVVIPSEHNGKAVTSLDELLYFRGRSITIPKSIKSIKIPDIANSYYLSYIIINYLGTIDNWCEINFDEGYLFLKRNYFYINGKIVENVNITTAKKINAWAFSGCSTIKSVTIGSSVKEIGGSAFYLCGALTSVAIGNSVTTIGERAFANCDSLTSVSMGKNVKEIGGGAFVFCINLQNITLPNSLTNIGETGLFYKKELLNCKEYKNGLYIGSADNPYLILLGVSNVSEKKFEIHDKCKFLHHYAFYCCNNLTEVTVPKSVKYICRDAFYNCKALSKLTYAGSMAQWQELEKGNLDEFISKINCSDGVIETSK